jgi:hypothetical protein
MANQIFSKYYVGQNQPYAEINNVINVIKAALDSGQYSLPAEDTITISIVGGGLFAPVRIPDNTTSLLDFNGKKLSITRQEFTEGGALITDSMPVIDPNAPGAQNLPNEQRLTGVIIGDNNPGITIQGLRIQGFVIGVSAGFNSNNLTVSRCFITNCVNTQIYAHDLRGLYIANNVLVGGEYGIIAQFINKLRVYHNTIYLDGKTALNGVAKAGMILQAERDFPDSSGSVTPSTIYSIGNLVYTIGAPAVAYYEQDLSGDRIISDYNNFYSTSVTVQTFQDNAQLSEGSSVIGQVYADLLGWQSSGIMGCIGDGSGLALLRDFNSITVHPFFIQDISLFGGSETALLNLNQLANSPLLSKVPNLNYNTSFGEMLCSASVALYAYVPDDFDIELISKDSLLNNREIPFTAIGANDAPSLNGFFGQDIFTNPLLIDPEKKCDINPLDIITTDSLEMIYPSITAGYFWSQERPYYLYAKKGAGYLGNYAKTSFELPGNISTRSSIIVKVRDQQIADSSWDIIGRSLIVYHKDLGLETYEDEVQIEGEVSFWTEQTYNFSTTAVYYIFKIKDGDTEFCLPSNYVSSAPVAITDDRINYTTPSDACCREFCIEFDELSQESKIAFQGTENLLENGDFTYTDGFTPMYWQTPAQPFVNPSLFMLSEDFSYWGDRCVGIHIDSNPGSIKSEKIRLTQDKSLTFSWHSRLPEDMYYMGQTGSNLTGSYFVNMYDSTDTIINPVASGSFEMSPQGYKRYYVTCGNSEIKVDNAPIELDSAPLVSVYSQGNINIPSGCARAELIISGHSHSSDITTGAFMILDAIQAEYYTEPTFYHPRPSFTNMTVEFETNTSGIFTDKHLNIAPVYHEDPNGFLYITDMPANIWGGPNFPEVTSLHEYRWPDGRLVTLPWSRLWGKDKLRQKVGKELAPHEALDVITMYNKGAEPVEISMTPEDILTRQDGEKDGLYINIEDQLGNPYGLRGYTMSVYEPGGNFPGWLSKSHLGAKQQLGGTVFGTLSSAGGATAFYTPPPSELIKYIGEIPAPSATINKSGMSGILEDISFIETKYPVNKLGNGNITIINESGSYLPIKSSDLYTGYYYPEKDGDVTSVLLEYPPEPGSVRIYDNVTGDSWFETYGIPGDQEFLVSEMYATIDFSNAALTGEPLYIEYNPLFAYPDPIEQNIIWFRHEKVFGNYSGFITVDYDALMGLEVSVRRPLSGEIIQAFPIVAQNSNIALMDANKDSKEY